MLYAGSVHGGNKENPIFKLYIRNFINISSFHNLLDVIYTEISGTMKKFTVWIGMQCDKLLFDKIDNCTLNPSVSDSGLVVKGELQRQNKLISSERPFKILQNETKIIKIGQAVLEIFNF